MSRNYSSIVEPKTLTADVLLAATQITLNNVTGLPSAPYVLVLNPDTASEEVILVDADQSGVTSPTLKVTRAIETGATAKTHTNGDTVKHMIVGSDLQLVHDHIDLTAAHGATGAVVGTTNTQTLTNKTLTSPKINENVAVTATATELNYVDGVTSGIQTQIDTITGTTIPAAVSAAVPTGVINQFAGDAADVPTGWLLCDGSTFSSTTYSTLATLLADKYGTHLGTDYYLPNLKGKIPVGLDASQTEFDLLGETGGAKTVTLTQGQIPSFNHEIQMSAGGGDGTTYVRGSSGGYSTSLYYGHGSGEAHPNLQPYIVVNYIIKY